MKIVGDGRRVIDVVCLFVVGVLKDEKIESKREGSLLSVLSFLIFSMGSFRNAALLLLCMGRTHGVLVIPPPFSLAKQPRVIILYQSEEKYLRGLYITGHEKQSAFYIMASM